MGSLGSSGTAAYIDARGAFTVLDALSKSEMFRGVPIDGLMRLAETGINRRFGPGAQLMRQGDISDTMYVILSGRVKVERSDSRVGSPLELAELGPGDVVGEMGLLDGEPRSATVTALESTEVMELDDLALAQLVLHYPDVSGGLLRILSRRLRSTDEVATDLWTRVGAAGAAEP
jgi:CRP/FNR family cyclic AMP-dependent transcriptional regulator